MVRGATSQKKSACRQKHKRCKSTKSEMVISIAYTASNANNESNNRKNPLGYSGEGKATWKLFLTFLECNFYHLAYFRCSNR